MHISEYDYNFPQESIALHPPKERGASKLFIVHTETGVIEIDKYENLDKYLTPQDLLVRNVTKVFHARLFGKIIKRGGYEGGEIEIFITEPHAQSLEEYTNRQYDPIERGFRLEFLAAKKKLNLVLVDEIDFGDGYRMKKMEMQRDSFSGVFYKTDEKITVDKLFSLFEEKGKVPLPPYIKRATNDEDDLRYQTIFAKKLGSVAAPTASLNFTKTLEERLLKQGTKIEEITLHVGRGTFLPLRNERIESNVLHAEPFYAKGEVIEHIRNAKREHIKVIAMGTTTTRTLETIANRILNETSASDILSETQLFIYPPYNFKIVDGLLTNFHFPKSSLITLVDAFLRWKNSKLSWWGIYQFAMKNEAKLFSYGDSMLIL